MLAILATRSVPSSNYRVELHARNSEQGYTGLGTVHILRNHQGGWGFRNDCASVIFALSNAKFDYRGGRGSKNRQKVIT